MISRAPYLLLVASASAPLFLHAGDQPHRISAAWTEDASSPAVAVDRPEWFISVVPPELDLESLEAPRLLHGEGSRDSRILHADPEQRLCLVEIATPFEGVTPTPLAAAPPFKAGQKLQCLTGEAGCLTLVAGKDWCYRGEHFPLPFLRLRISESSAPCAAGTPLLDGEGGLAGILTGHRLETSGELHAIPVSRVKKLVEDMKRHRRSGPVWVGLVFHNEASTPEVIEVRADSPASDADLRPGDVVIALDGNEVDSLVDLVEIFHDLPAGDEVSIRVLRGIEEHRLSLTPRFADMSAAAR